MAGASGGVEETGPIDEDLFDDEDLDELEELGAGDEREKFQGSKS